MALGGDVHPGQSFPFEVPWSSALFRLIVETFSGETGQVEGQAPHLCSGAVGAGYEETLVILVLLECRVVKRSPACLVHGAFHEVVGLIELIVIGIVDIYLEVVAGSVEDRGHLVVQDGVGIRLHAVRAGPTPPGVGESFAGLFVVEALRGVTKGPQILECAM